MAYKDKADQAANAKRHYEANKATYKARARAFTQANIKKNRLYVEQLKKDSMCSRCGFDDYRTLIFHHLRDKDTEVAKGARSWSLNRLKAEIAKCEIICANCHHIEHHTAIN